MQYIVKIVEVGGWQCHHHAWADGAWGVGHEQAMRVQFLVTC